MGEIEAHWNVNYTRILKYSIEMYHEGLKEHKLLTAPEEDILENKIKLQILKWQEKWAQIEAKRRSLAEREASIEEAERRTEDAKKVLEEIDNLLIHTFSVDDAVDWEVLKRHEDFPEPMPEKPKALPKKEYPPEPVKLEPEFSLLHRLFRSLKEKKIESYKIKNQALMVDWEKAKAAVDEYNLSVERDYEKAVKQWEEEVKDWEQRRQAFLQKQEDYNNQIDELKEGYYKLQEDSVLEYCSLVLENSVYPETFPKSFELEYHASSKMLIVEYQLPSIECFPTLKEVKYLTSKREMKEIHLSENQVQKMFDDAIYKITLRTIHEIFEADKADAIDTVVFNGWIRAINKATGKEESNCILSVQVSKAVFLDIDLANVDPKTCFKNLRGVAASKLAALSPIKPIMQINRSDKRFVDSYEVANQLDESTNLAAMDWEDFEHLIRELFEKEFQSTGGEVRVTQASRDGGVDAIAYDPDPIRGGKIVIQAKRYTNTVGVSAVRDLYGAVMNEGATKGILVTTSDFGPDAYEFAKDKPLTLLNGSNLLYLLEKHGHRAKIDLQEAKRILSERG
jgi:restriction system protein